MVLELNRKITQSIEAKLFYYSKIFVIFDKDDFCNNQIKQVISLCKNNDYIACLSNECFEVWIYLHFHALSINIPRKDLFFKLSNIFTSYGIGAYQKNDVNLFYKLNKYGNILKAYERAKKLDILKDSDDLLPQTTMYLLLDEIENHQRELELPSIYEIFRK